MNCRRGRSYGKTHILKLKSIVHCFKLVLVVAPFGSWSPLVREGGLSEAQHGPLETHGGTLETCGGLLEAYWANEGLLEAY